MQKWQESMDAWPVVRAAQTGDAVELSTLLPRPMKRRDLLRFTSVGLLVAASARSDAQSSDPLSYTVFTATRQGLNRDVPAGKESLMWVANSSTLISGRKDAVLVDTFLTVAQANTLADSIQASDKRLKAIYITHAHGDHFLGLKILLDRFPDARALATPEVAAAMRLQATPEKLDARWRKLFPGQIPEVVAVAEPLASDTIELEGKALIAIRLGHTDTDNSTCLYAPSIGLVAAGDAVYNGIHPFLIESTRQNRLAWLSSLDKIEALGPRSVVAGHKVPTRDDDPRCIGETRRYIHDFIRLNDETGTPRELYDRMLAIYPDLVNPGSLWSSAQAAKKES